MKIEGPLRDVVWGASGIAVTVVAYMIGSSAGRSTTLDAAAVASLTKEKAAADVELRKTTDSLSANKARLAKLDGYEAKTANLQNQIANRQHEVSSLSVSLSGKRSELESLTGKVERVRRQPIELPAGHFTVGRDIRPGRFTVVGESNFVVRGRDGDLKANTILGGGGVERYVCELEDGDQIEAEGADSFYPMD